MPLKFCLIFPSFVWMACVARIAIAEPIPTGKSQTSWEVNGKPIEVFTYKPEKYRDGSLLIVCHGKARGAEGARNYACSIADEMGVIVVAPLFDALRFRTEAFQQGGITRLGVVQPANQWTVSYFPKIAEIVRVKEGNLQLPYYLLGHSAGGQILERLAATMQTEALRIVAANPGSHIFPTRDVSYPHGFGGLPKEMSDDDALKRYLAQPLTLYLGTADVGSKDLPVDANAVKQGATRYERGKNCYRFAAELAAKNGWPFRWRLVEAPDVGHSAKEMYENPRLKETFSVE